MSVCKWILAFHHRRKVGVYLSDISGAFDRVRTDLLLAKCRAVGMTDVWILFLTSYLQPRRAIVLVDGSRSSEFILQNMVFQGTLLGPTLWNVFFAYSRPVIEASGADELKYADDMTATKEFELNVPHDLIFAQLHRTQTAAHEWGNLNQVIFDHAK